MSRKDGTNSSEGTLKLLNLILEYPDLHTAKSLASELNLSSDAIKRKIRVLRENGFNVIHSDYPDYTYSVKNVIKNKINLVINDKKRT